MTSNNMQNFDFTLSTDVLFGKGQVNQLPRVLKTFGKKVLLTYGGGSIKRTGLYDKITKLLSDFEIYELSGIDPNPLIESVEAGVEICRKNNIDVILAVGGGSTIDCSKAIAAATLYDGGAWEMMMSDSASTITKALPICTVLTLAAAGSETNGNAVISNDAVKIKTAIKSAHVIPKYSILDPENTFTVPPSQTAAGAADIMSHIFEVYFCKKSCDITDSIAEGVMKTVIKNAFIALDEPTNYDARANLMWASSLAICGICDIGNIGGPWSCHSMEHELSAYYDLTHGVGLAILTPHWMRYILNEETVDKFVQYGVNVWGIDENLDKMEIAKIAIDKTEDFFNNLNIPNTLTKVEIDDKHFKVMAEHCVNAGGLKQAYVPLDVDDVVNIYKMCL